MVTKNKGWKWILFLLMLTVGAVYASILMIFPFLPQYLQTMGVRKEELSMWTGIIAGAPFFTMFFISPIWGRMADRWGFKWMILRAVVGTTLVMFLMAWATNPWELLSLRLLEGLISGVIPVSMAMVSAVAPKERSHSALGLLQTGAMIGVTIGPLLGGWFVQIFQSPEDAFSKYRYTFLIASVALLFISLLVFLMLPDKKEAAEEARSKKVSQDKFWAQSKRFLFQRSIGGLLCISFLIAFSVLNYVSFMSLLIQQLTVSMEDEAIIWTSWSWASAALASGMAAPMLGKLGDRWGSDKVLALCLIFTSGALFFSAGVASAKVIPICSFLLGFFSAGLMPSLSTLLIREVSSHELGSIYGLQSSLTSLGKGIGPIFLGSGASLVGGLMGTRLAFFTAGVTILGTFFLFWFLQWTKQKSEV